MTESSAIQSWFRSKFGEPTAAQAAAWPRIEAGRNTLIVSPTGTGKTLAAFLAVLKELERLHEAGELGGGIQVLYISPLRALGYDMEKNLAVPLREVYGEKPPIRIGLRSGDTEAHQRQKLFDQPPHILLTTPESICLLLSQEKWEPVLQRVRWVIVDEIHALAENKRGTLLSLALERLDDLRQRNAAPGAGSRVQRVGLSATVSPVEEIAAFLAGGGGECGIVDASSAKKIEMSVYTPLSRDPYPVAGFSGERLMRELGQLIRQQRTTLVFSNTRSGAEAATFWLRESMPDLAHQIECHHASLDRDLRLEVEDRLKRGELRAVVCSTSLELGVDIGMVDLVVMLATPKGVTKALQRTGRAGHNVHQVSRGLLMATNVNDLVECCATVLLARSRMLDRIRVPRAPLDVLAQHLVGMGCCRRWKRDEAFELARRAWSYRDLDRKDFDDVLDYLAGGGKALRRQYADLFGKIALDDESFETRAGITRRDFLQNVGVIPNEGVVRVMLHGRVLGTVEELFARNLHPGDVFMLAGRPVQVERMGMMEMFVGRADGKAPTIPRWNASKFPLSNRVASEIATFRKELRVRLESGESGEALVDWLERRLDCGRANARIIRRVHEAQHRVSEIPTNDFLLVEDCVASLDDEASAAGFSPAPRMEQGRKSAKSRREVLQQIVAPTRHYFFHSLIGRSANDTVARVLALRLNRKQATGNAVVTPNDYGFVLSVTPEQELVAEDLPELLTPENFAADLNASLAQANLLKYHFRNAAQTGLMVYRNFFGEQKSTRKLQFSSEVIFNVLVQHEPDHVLLREARRDTVYSSTYLDLETASRFLEAQVAKPFRLRQLPYVPPLSFGMYASRIREVLSLEDPAETLERLYHHWWSRIEHEPE
ncbi:MAG TPA: DEAD/DEAH box helicase [Verrucomicrobiae bacterium]|nr:DEAD/DEAH box helicase [Verrucomicrobiae bacterium]